MTWAFSDESERAAMMLVGVLIVPAGTVQTARRELRGLLLSGQRQVHTAKESERRRRLLLDVVGGIDAAAVVLQLRRTPGVSRVQARARLLEAATSVLVDAGAVSWVLDSQDTAQATRDRHTIDRAIHRAGFEVVYDHRPAPSEPLLWAVDAIIWAVGAGGDWQRRVQHLVETREIGA